MVGILLVLYFVFMAGSAENGTLSGEEIVVGVDKPAGEEVVDDKKEQEDVGFVPGTGLPTIPGSLVKRIKNGEFVEFGELLSEFIGKAFLAKQGGKSLRKPPMVDKLADWFLAFSGMAAVLIDSNKGSAAQLISYQASIIRLYHDYPSKAWLAYDRAFRQKMVASKRGNWGQIDHDLWALALGPQSSSLLQQQYMVSQEVLGILSYHGICKDVPSHIANFRTCVQHAVVRVTKSRLVLRQGPQAGSGGSSWPGWRVNHVAQGGSVRGNSGMHLLLQQMPGCGFPRYR